MIRRPPRSTLFPYHDALPIYRAEVKQLGADAVVGKPQGLYETSAPDVASVEEDRFPQETTNPLKVWKAILVPLGHEQQAVSPLEDPIRISIEDNAVSEELTSTLECHRVGGPYLGAARQKPTDDLERRRLAHVVRAGLESKAP